MSKILSIRRNNQVFSLFLKIQEYQKSANRTDIVNAAINKALEGRVKWKDLSENRVPKIYIDNDDFPDFIQLRVNSNDYMKIVKQMKDDFHLEKNSPAPFVVKLLLINYLIYLENSGVESNMEPELPKQVTDAKGDLLNKFKNLSSIDEKLDAIYGLLLEIKK